MNANWRNNSAKRILRGEFIHYGNRKTLSNWMCWRQSLIRIETKAGYGRVKPTTKIIQETADRWTFLVKELGMKAPK